MPSHKCTAGGPIAWAHEPSPHTVTDPTSSPGPTPLTPFVPLTLCDRCLTLLPHASPPVPSHPHTAAGLPAGAAQGAAHHQLRAAAGHPRVLRHLPQYLTAAGDLGVTCKHDV